MLLGFHFLSLLNISALVISFLERVLFFFFFLPQRALWIFYFTLFLYFTCQANELVVYLKFFFSEQAALGNLGSYTFLMISILGFFDFFQHFELCLFQ